MITQDIKFYALPKALKESGYIDSFSIDAMPSGFSTELTNFQVKVIMKAIDCTALHFVSKSSPFKLVINGFELYLVKHYCSKELDNEETVPVEFFSIYRPMIDVECDVCFRYEDFVELLLEYIYDCTAP